MFQSFNKGNILVVEDEKDLREQLVSILEEKGCRVEAAADAYSAIEQVKKHEFDVILLDLMLSRDKNALQGIDFLDFLKAEKVATPVILLTNKADNETISEAIRTGAANVRSFLTKNIVVSQNILYLIEQAIRNPFETKNLSRLLEEDKKISVIQGISSDLHFRMQEYIGYFPEYMWQFKGKVVEATPVSYLDDIFVELDAYDDQGQVQQYFEEFLSYPLQFPRIDSRLEPNASDETLESGIRELKSRARTLVEEIASNVAIQSVPRTCISVPVAGENVRVFAYDTWKIYTNKIVSDRNRPAVLARFDRLKKDCEYLIPQMQTLQALHEIENFCTEYGLDDIKANVSVLISYFRATFNDQIRGLIDANEADRRIAEMNSFILINLLIDISENLPGVPEA